MKDRPAGHVLLSRLAETEVLVAPERTEWFESCVRAVERSEHADAMLSDVMGGLGGDDYWPEADSWEARYKPYVVTNGVLQIPVVGVLMNRFGYQFGRYATGYTYIQKAFERGMADPAVRGIAFVIDSPGGEVAGNFELVDKLFAARGEKPVRAFAADHAYSAAYSIASAADKISMTRSGGVGSIGVVTMHVDYSEAMKDAGVKVTFIYAGKHKVDGNAYEKLPDAVKARIQARIDRTYGIFTSTVARNRGMDEQAVRDTEALTYGAEEALEIGLADSVGVFEEALEAFANEVSTATGEDSMKTEQTAAEGISQAAHDAAVTAARNEGMAAGRKAASDRMTAIMGLDNAKGREKHALKMALTTDLSAEQVDGLLADFPKAEAAAPEAPKGDDKATTNHFDAAMSQGNPEVGAASSKGDKGGAVNDADTILADYRGFTGAQAKKTA
jgi:signal peptide peptidase SppA